MKGKILSLTNDTLVPLSFVSMILGTSYWVGKNVTARIDATEHSIAAIQGDEGEFRNLMRLQFDEQRRILSEIKAQTAASDARLQMLIDMDHRGHP